MSTSKRVFSEQETSAILQKAAKMQEAAVDGEYTPGITREELEKIANEAGIDPKFVTRALDDISKNEPKKGWLNLSEEYERVIEGEVDPDDFDEIFRDLKPANNRMGVQQVGRTVSMQTFYKSAMCSIEMTSRQGRTRVKVKSVPFMAYFFSLHPALIGGIVGGANVGAHGNALLGGLIFLAASTLGIFGFAGLVKKGHRSAKALVEVLEERIEDHTSRLRSNLEKAKPISQEAPAYEDLRDVPG